MDKIYVVTGVPREEKIGKIPSCAFGWYPNHQDAVDAVLRNDGDLYEAGWYPFVVVEAFEPGMMPTACITERWWFSWDEEKACYRSCDRPECYSNAIGFGMG